MFELFASIIFVLSFGGVLFILARKIPVLVGTVPAKEESQKNFLIANLSAKIKSGVKNLLPKEIILQKILSRFRVAILRFEKKTDNLLQKLRKRTLEKNDKKQENPESSDAPK